MRIGNLFGPDATFVGVPAADLDDEASYAGAAAVIIGGPFDGGRRTGPGPGSVPRRSASPTTCPMTGAGPTSLGRGPLLELGVVDVGDVEMPPGNTELSLQRLEAAVTRIAASGRSRGARR